MSEAIADFAGFVVGGIFTAPFGGPFIRVGAKAANGARRVWRNVSIDGFSKGLKYANGRVFGLRYRNTPRFRLDLHPNPSPTRLHMHFGDLKAHRPWYAPWRKY